MILLFRIHSAILHLTFEDVSVHALLAAVCLSVQWKTSHLFNSLPKIQRLSCVCVGVFVETSFVVSLYTNICIPTNICIHPCIFIVNLLRSKFDPFFTISLWCNNIKHTPWIGLCIWSQLIVLFIYSFICLTLIYPTTSHIGTKNWICCVDIGFTSSSSLPVSACL